MKFLAVLVLVAVASCERLRFDGCDVWELEAKTEKQLRQLHNFYEAHDNEFDREVTFWNEPRFLDQSVEVLVCSNGISFLQNFLYESGVVAEVTQKNIQSQLDALWSRSDARHAQSAVAYDPNDYNTFDDINAHLEELNENCPSGVTCTLEEIGESYEGRPIMAFRMTQPGENRRGIWVDALTHAREWLSGSTVLSIMDRLVYQYGSNAEVTNLVDSYNWHFVPVVNPDGYVYSWTDNRNWRKTRNLNAGSSCIGTDANRNFDFMWGTLGASSNPCSDTYYGASAASEPETKAVQDASLALKGELVLFLTFHTFGNYYLYPYGTASGLSCMTAPNDANLDRIAAATIEAVEATYGTSWVSGSSCRTLYFASGTTADWAYGVGLVNYAFTPELRGPGFTPTPAEIEPSLEENWNGLLAMIN